VRGSNIYDALSAADRARPRKSLSAGIPWVRGNTKRTECLKSDVGCFGLETVFL